MFSEPLNTQRNTLTDLMASYEMFNEPLKHYGITVYYLISELIILFRKQQFLLTDKTNGPVNARYKRICEWCLLYTVQVKKNPHFLFFSMISCLFFWEKLGEIVKNFSRFLQEIQFFLQEIPVFLPEILGLYL